MVFREYVEEIQTFIKARKSSDSFVERKADPGVNWTISRKGGLVLAQETAVELGHPLSESTSYILCTDDASRIGNGRISLLGPDLGESRGKKLPFGKIVLVGMNDWDEDSLYERWRELDMIRYETNLSGYMLRATPQDRREWSRVGFDAMDRGFSLFTLGSVLVREFMKKPYVESVEILFVTISPEEVKSLQPLGTKNAQVMAAMNKMVNDLTFDCDTCEYVDVCSEVGELQAMRARQQQQCG